MILEDDKKASNVTSSEQEAINNFIKSTKKLSIKDYPNKKVSNVTNNELGELVKFIEATKNLESDKYNYQVRESIDKDGARNFSLVTRNEKNEVICE